jgi:hypothetical protein
MKLAVRLSGVFLIAILACGIGLRLHHLDKRSMWVDELFTLAIAKYHPLVPEAGQPLYRRIQVMQIRDGDSFLTAKAAEQSPPLNDLLEKATVNWFGATEFAARLPAAVFACLLLVWFAGFAWRHPDPSVRRVLRWSLYLLALHPALVLYAQEGRAYSAGVSLLGMGGLLWMLRWRAGWRHWHPPGWVEIALFSLACYAHYNAALLVALLLVPDTVMTIRQRALQGWARLGTLTLVVCVWLLLNAHTILYTSKGGVGWGDSKPLDQLIWNATQDAAAILHPYWLILAALLLVFLIGAKNWKTRAHDYLSSATAQKLCSLAVLTVIYLVLAGKVAATAGMAHPRFFIFVVPFVTVMFATLLAEIRQDWAIFSLALLIAACASPSMRLENSSNTDDFRSMTIAAVRGSDGNTEFLYPLSPLRDVYRVSLHRYLGVDPIRRMTEIAVEQDAGQVCERLKGKGQVVALGHAWGQPLVDAVYKTCGQQWPSRTIERFHNTFTEHWRVK